MHLSNIYYIYITYLLCLLKRGGRKTKIINFHYLFLFLTTTIVPLEINAGDLRSWEKGTTECFLLALGIFLFGSSDISVL